MEEIPYSDEIYAAIAAALHAHAADKNCHDIESTVLTINRDTNYSTWNSKLLSMRQTPR